MVRVVAASLVGILFAGAAFVGIGWLLSQSPDVNSFDEPIVLSCILGASLFVGVSSFFRVLMFPE